MTTASVENDNDSQVRSPITQEVIKAMNIEQNTPEAENDSSSNIMVPSLEIKGQLIAEAVPLGVNHGNNVEKIIDETKV